MGFTLATFYLSAFFFLESLLALGLCIRHLDVQKTNPKLTNKQTETVLYGTSENGIRLDDSLATQEEPG